MSGQECRNALRVPGVPLHTYWQRLQTLQKQERVEWAKRRPDISQVLDPGLDQVPVLAKGLVKADPVVPRRRLGHSGKIAVIPWETSGLDDNSTDSRTVSANKLGRGVDDDIGAMLEWPAEIRRGEGVVDHQRYAGLMGNLGNSADVEHTDAGIADRLAVNDACLRGNCPPKVLRF